VHSRREEWRLNRSTAPDPEHLSSPECSIVLSHQHMLSKTLVVLDLSLPSFDSTNKKHNVSIQNHFLLLVNTEREEEEEDEEEAED
jgi:hypothetical protein